MADPNPPPHGGGRRQGRHRIAGKEGSARRRVSLPAARAALHSGKLQRGEGRVRRATSDEGRTLKPLQGNDAAAVGRYSRQRRWRLCRAATEGRILLARRRVP